VKGSRSLPFWRRLLSEKGSHTGVGIAGHVDADETAAEQAARFQVLDRPVTEARGRNQVTASPAESGFFEGFTHSLIASFAGLCEPYASSPADSTTGG